MTAILTGGLLANLRRAAAGFLTDSCEIQAATETVDAAGGASSTWATVATAACSIQPASGRESGNESPAADQIQSKAAYVIYLPYSQAITALHRIKQTTGAVVTYYRIASVIKRAGQEGVRKCLADVIEAETTGA